MLETSKIFAFQFFRSLYGHSAILADHPNFEPLSAQVVWFHIPGLLTLTNSLYLVVQRPTCFIFYMQVDLFASCVLISPSRRICDAVKPTISRMWTSCQNCEPLWYCSQWLAVCNGGSIRYTPSVPNYKMFWLFYIYCFQYVSIQCVSKCIAKTMYIYKK